jgi:DNA-binding response OmpR family regulator
MMQKHNTSVQILVVEDDEDTRTLLEFLLKRAGFEVVTAVDGEHAMQQIEMMNPPALILLDVMMPFLDGFDILGRVRARAGWNQVPVLILTAQDRQENIERGNELGVTDYIIKPFRIDELVKRITAIVGNPLS